MPRQIRKKSCSNIYHCMLRGINKQDIFFDKYDYLKFQNILRKSKEVFSYKLYSYVLMPNHIHLEIKDENEELSQIIHNIATSYAIYFNKKYQRVGHVFENRFLSKNVENSYYILNLIRYIHQNPAKAGISKMSNYQWSSYLEYFKSKNITNSEKIVDTQEILSIFSSKNVDVEKEFFEFNKKTVRFEESVELLEYEMRNKLTDKEVIYFIKKQCGINNIQEIQKYNIQYRNNIIEKVKKIQGVTQKQIARVLGINIRIIQRASNKREYSNLSQK